MFGGSNVVVSGLPAGQSADVTVGISRSGYTDASATQTGSALAAGTAPALTNVTPTTDGFTFDIANFQPGVVYTFDATNGGEITQAGSHVVVWNLVPGESSDVTVTATDPGVSIASADVSGTALLTGTVPTFTAPVSLADGFAFAISNYSPDVHYTATTTDGVVTVNGSDVSVSGLRLRRIGDRHRAGDAGWLHRHVCCPEWLGAAGRRCARVLGSGGHR